MDRDYHRRVESAVARVSKPARYAGNEWNSVQKDHSGLGLTFALAFPDVYEVGMSHLGSKILYHELNRRDDTACERVFAPWTDLEKIMRQESIPLFSLESRKPIREFDILGFTLQYELSYTNLINMLDLARIPLMARERGEGDPLVIAGGPCAYNPEPLAEFLDAVVLGDGEEVIHEIAQVFIRWKTADSRTDGRAGILSRLALIRGVYVPSFYETDYRRDGTVERIRPCRPEAALPVQRRVIADLDEVDYPTRPIVPFMDVVHDRAMLEVFRGCTRGCRFCHAGTVYRPVRERSPSKVMELAEELIRNTGYDEIGLVSLATSDYSRISDVVAGLTDRYGCEGVGLSLPSLRVDSFSVDLADRVQRVRRTGLTLAPEAGTQRLRNVINKGITDEDILGAARKAFTAGWNQLKLYFMIGLPTETDDDLEGIAGLVCRILDIYREVTSGRKARPPKINVSVSSFVPKPDTPFQWDPQLSVDEIRRRQSFLGARMRDRRIVYHYHDPEVSRLEGVIARGDRRLAAGLLEAWRRGCRFDSWTEFFNPAVWAEALRVAGIDPEFYANRSRGYEEALPWDHLSSGVSKDFLWDDRRRALDGQLTDDCRWRGCENCGVCPEAGVWPTLKNQTDEQ